MDSHVVVHNDATTRARVVACVERIIDVKVVRGVSEMRTARCMLGPRVTRNDTNATSDRGGTWLSLVSLRTISD